MLKAAMPNNPAGSAYRTGPRPGFRLLETIGWTPAGGFALLPRHLQRLRESAACFEFECDIHEVQALLDNAVSDLAGPSKIRLLVSKDGAIVCEGIDLAAPHGGPLRVSLAAEPIDKEDVFLYHKTTRREVYERARASRPDRDTVLLWNLDNEVTEGLEANVVVELDGGKVTPPVGSGLLPGTLRADLLERGVIEERSIALGDLQRATGVWLINSVRGWMPSTLLP